MFKSSDLKNALEKIAKFNSLKIYFYRILQDPIQFTLMSIFLIVFDILGVADF